MKEGISYLKVKASGKIFPYKVVSAPISFPSCLQTNAPVFFQLHSTPSLNQNYEFSVKLSHYLKSIGASHGVLIPTNQFVLHSLLEFPNSKIK